MLIKPWLLFFNQQQRNQSPHKKLPSYSFPTFAGELNLTNLSTRYGVTLNKITMSL